jgi:prepilin-type N-terminal cleavage/methylation domain-containing protein
MIHAPSRLDELPTLGKIRRPAGLLLEVILRPSRFLSGTVARILRGPSGRQILRASGFTLVEMTVAIAVILVLVGAASLGVKPYYAYRDGRSAGESLRAVKAAQLMYLSDNPTSTAITSLSSGVVSSLTSVQVQVLLLPYMPNGAWPTLPSVGTVVPTINCTIFPPVAVLTVGGANYDPSGSTTDGLWDVGLY